MFNRSFSITQFVKDIPSMPLRCAVWYSLVGTVNVQLIGAADYLATRLIADGLEADDLKGLTAREIKALFSGPDDDAGSLRDAQKLYKLHVEWREQLLRNNVVSPKQKAGAKDRGSIKASMAFMSGPQQVIDNPDGVKKAIAAGIEDTPEKREASRQRRLERVRRFAAQRSSRAGMTEYIIDQLFASSTTSFDDEDDENYSTLDETLKELLYTKLKTALEKALARAEDNTYDGVTGDNQLGIGDYLIAKKLIETLPSLAYITKEAKVNAPCDPRAKKVAQPEVQRAPAPTQSASVTEVLPNGIKLTRAATAA